MALNDVTTSECPISTSKLIFLVVFLASIYSEIFSGRQTSPGVKISDVSERESVRNVVIFLNFDAAVCPRRFH
jgi:hypothetical protein